MRNHTIWVVVVEVVARRLLKALEPLLVPQDSNTNELATDNERLVNYQNQELLR